MANRLAHETSAYLLQHQHNPVDWYPWGDEAWAKARELDRPVLVSIGYSSCHWCHVMERESFENPETAARMNARLVCIKVDREERPDVDQVYMETVVRLTGQGGWPLNVFCTPGGRPFHGGTYFPPEPLHGRPSWRELIEAVARAWSERRGAVEGQAEELIRALEERPGTRAERPARPPGIRALGASVSALMARADRTWGGFGSAPKFPTAPNLEAILLANALGGAPSGAFDHLLLTLRRMACGGLYDQLGGGFHRYSTDARWQVPHFEKMLYDQGQLLRVYSEAHRQARAAGVEADLEWPVLETIAFLDREMRGPDGNLFASLDADSDGEEGRFYVWTRAEVLALLGPEEGTAFCSAYSVDRPGSFEGGDANVLQHALAGERARFRESRERLFAARGRRTRPGTDLKGVASWMGYAISGLATAGAAFERRDWIDAAARTAQFALRELRDSEGGLQRIWDGERARIPAFLDDFAALLAGLLDLHRAGAGAGAGAGGRWIEAAIELADAICDRFFDPLRGDLFLTASDAETLVTRPTSEGDGATPGPGALAVLGLVRLGELCGRSSWLEVADRVLETWGPVLERAASGVPTLARAAALRDSGVGVAIIVGAPDDPLAAALARRSRELLGCEDLVVRISQKHPPAWLDPSWLEGRIPGDGRATAYLCRARACSLPAHEPNELSLPD